MEAMHKTIVGRIDALADTLLDVSHSIHAHPELAFQERHACELLSKITRLAACFSTRC